MPARQHRWQTPRRVPSESARSGSTTCSRAGPRVPNPLLHTRSAHESCCRYLSRTFSISIVRRDGTAPACRCQLDWPPVCSVTSIASHILRTRSFCSTASARKASGQTAGTTLAKYLSQGGHATDGTHSRASARSCGTNVAERIEALCIGNSPATRQAAKA